MRAANARPDRPGADRVVRRARPDRPRARHRSGDPPGTVRERSRTRSIPTRSNRSSSRCARRGRSASSAGTTFRSGRRMTCCFMTTNRSPSSEWHAPDRLRPRGCRDPGGRGLLLRRRRLCGHRGGGGGRATPAAANRPAPLPHEFISGADLLDIGQRTGLSIAGIVP